MSDQPQSSYDDSQFAAGPARDARFQVVNRWVECANFPEGDPRRRMDFPV